MLKENFVKTIEASLRTHWDLPAFADYGRAGSGVTYGEAADRMLYLHGLFGACGVKAGDRVALFGRNSRNWAIAYLATVTAGAVVVPILPDFHESDVHHIVNHSGAKLLFVAGGSWDKLELDEMPGLRASFALEDFSLLDAPKGATAKAVARVAATYLVACKGRLTPASLKFPKIANKELASIVYTSGTSGFSKGVMLTHNNLMGNVKYTLENLHLKAGDRVLSFLPIAHSYGCAFDFLYPVARGVAITFLGRIPSPKILLEALRAVRPQLILSVPLILEKIYKHQIAPKLGKTTVRLLRRVPFVEHLLLAKIRASLIDAFGGEFGELVIGGAALAPEVESFFMKIGFPLTIGYGMTECGPLIAYAPWREHRLGSVGPTLPGLMEVKIASRDPENVPGEILARGELVMQGYYRNKSATGEALVKGWLRTGDLGVIDRDGHISLRGRCKSMLLGPSGQNIYPEEIEAKLNNLPYIQESMIVHRDGLLVALVYPEMDRVDKERLSEADLGKVLERVRLQLNRQLPAFSTVSRIEVMPAEFEKTPKKSIKRFLYQ